MPQMPTRDEDAAGLVACRLCDLLHRESRVAPGMRAHCARCGSALSTLDPDSLGRTLALVVASGVFLVLANVYPIMEFSYAGRSQSTRLIDGVVWLAEGGLTFVALLVFSTSILFPLLRVAALLYVLVPLRVGVPLPGAQGLFRAATVLDRWGMLDVYSLAILVTVVKLGQLADARVELGCAALVAAAITMIAMSISLDVRDVWRRFEVLR